MTEGHTDTRVETDETRRTDRWRGLGGATLAAGAVGLFARRPALLLASAVGLALLAYGRVVAAPPASLSIVREVSDPDPDPGQRVRVTVRVENTGRRPLAGVRLADGVPPGWTVVDGAPSHGTALWPGGTGAFEYTVEVGPARDDFDPVTAILRDPAGVVERRTTIDPSGGFATTPMATGADAPDLPTAITRLVGRTTVDASGDGTAFRAVREYQHGDPPSRIDWRRRARTGELATVEFEAERRLTVVLVVDARPEAALAPDEDSPTAIQRSLGAAERLYGSLTDAGHRVGVATLGPDRRWLGPGRGDAHRRRAHERLTRSATTPRSDGGPEDGVWLRDRLPERATVLLLTPACDDAITGLARRVNASGRPVAVVSPDPTAGETAGRRLARLERSQRLRGLRASGVPALDWAPGTDVEAAMARGGWLS